MLQQASSHNSIPQTTQRSTLQTLFEQPVFGTGMPDHVNLSSRQPSDAEVAGTRIIKSLIFSYFNIVRKNIQDTVPKAVMAFLVNHTKNDIQSELVRSLYKEEMFEELLKEADDIAERRANCVELLAVMQESLAVLTQVRDFKIQL